MLKVALTGGIATGKSHVLARFQARGIPCLGTPTCWRTGTMAPGTEVSRAIAERFGNEVLDDEGGVRPTQKLGPIVFADRDARRDLEAIVHPAVRRAITAGLRAFERIGEYAFGDRLYPVLYEMGRPGDSDRVIATVCSACVSRVQSAKG